MWWIVFPAAAIAAVISYFLTVRIKSNKNYMFNSKKKMRGTDERGFIVRQEELSDRRFVFSRLSSVGCEIIAAYNAMLKIGDREELRDVIRDFEKKNVLFSPGLGALGSNPRKIPRYLRKKGIEFGCFSSFEKLKAETEKMNECAVIFTTKNCRSVMGIHSIHTFLIEKADGIYRSYNGYIDGGTTDISDAVQYAFDYAIVLYGRKKTVKKADKKSPV